MRRNPAVRYTGKIYKAGRVVIPAQIRGKAHLQPGATVTITAAPSGRIVLEPTVAVLHEAQEYFLKSRAGG